MRRSALLCCAIAASSALAGCTGTGVFLDHSFTWFGENPNTPAGNSEVFQVLRGEPVAVTPLLPEEGNVWPGPQKPDPTLQELQQEQQSQLPGDVASPDHRQPRPAGNSPVGPAPTAVLPGVTPNLVAPPTQTPNGPAVDVTGGHDIPGYRQLTPPAQTGKGIMVPNGNGTSTLIGPDGSVSTVPSPKP